MAEQSMEALVQRNKEYVESMVERARTDNLKDLNSTEIALVKSYQVAVHEVQQANQKIMQLRAELHATEDNVKALMGKCGGILSSLVALKFDEPKSKGNGETKTRNKRKK